MPDALTDLSAHRLKIYLTFVLVTFPFTSNRRFNLANMDNIFSYTEYNWLNEASLYNQDYKPVSTEWFDNQVDIIVLYFSCNGVDKNGIIEKFCEIYENAKYKNIPMEVINVPMDETEEEMKQSYSNQANWFTLLFHDPLVHILKYMYQIGSTPQLLVLKCDGTIISHHGIVDLEEHGRDAILTWLTSDSQVLKLSSPSKECVYGGEWKYQTIDPDKKLKSYNRKFSTAGAEIGDLGLLGK